MCTKRGRCGEESGLVYFQGRSHCCQGTAQSGSCRGWAAAGGSCEWGWVLVRVPWLLQWKKPCFWEQGKGTEGKPRWTDLCMLLWSLFLTEETVALGVRHWAGQSTVLAEIPPQCAVTEEPWLFQNHPSVLLFHTLLSLHFSQSWLCDGSAEQSLNPVLRNPSLGLCGLVGKAQETMSASLTLQSHLCSREWSKSRNI